MTTNPYRNRVVGRDNDQTCHLMFERYGHEFISSYEIDGNIVTSNARNDPKQWIETDPDKKVKQLCNWRIYNRYCRDREVDDLQ